MDQENKLQPICPPPHISANGFFACGVMSDYRTDWALANDSYCLEKKIDNAQKESWAINKEP